MTRVPSSPGAVMRRHLRAGWWGLAIFVVLGAILEVFHATKAPAYVDAGRETTRLLLRLAHAHGTLLALVNIAFALSLRARLSDDEDVSPPAAASACLLAALVLLPGGFLVGGIWAQAGDPGLGIVLVPCGATALFAGAVLAARAFGRAGPQKDV